MNNEEAKIIILDYMINSLENGSDDENIKEELLAILIIAKTLKNPFEKMITVKLIKELQESDEMSLK